MDITIPNPGRTRRGGEVGSQTFPDIPGFVDARWQGSKLRVRFSRDLTADEEQTVLDRCRSLTTAEEDLRGAARAYLNLKNRSAKQTEEQVVRLTRLLLEEYDGSQ